LFNVDRFNGIGAAVYFVLCTLNKVSIGITPIELTIWSISEY